MLSNVRGEPNYVGGAPNAQVHTPRPEIKMPQVGNFAPPPSAGKENKKRRGGAGSQVTGGAAAQAASMMAEAGSATSLTHGGRGLLSQGGNANKVSQVKSFMSSVDAMVITNDQPPEFISFAQAVCSLYCHDGQTTNLLHFGIAPQSSS